MRYLNEKAGKIHFSMISRKLRCVSTKDIEELCKRFGFSSTNVRTILIRKGALVPLFFKGIFYVRSSSELLTKTLPLDSLILATLACNKKFGKNWYFGLQTALKLNELSGVQTSTKAFIITKRQIKSKTRSMNGMEFIFSKIQIPSDNGIMEKNGLRYSDPVRTVLDFLHLGIKKKDTAYAEVVLDVVIELNKKKFYPKVKSLLKVYSTKKLMKKIIDKHLGGYHAL